MGHSTSHTPFGERHKTFQTTKTQPITISQEQLVKNSFLAHGGPTPLVITANVADINLSDWIANNREHIRSMLTIHGGNPLSRVFTPYTGSFPTSPASHRHRNSLPITKVRHHANS